MRLVESNRARQCAAPVPPRPRCMLSTLARASGGVQVGGQDGPEQRCAWGRRVRPRARVEGTGRIEAAVELARSETAAVHHLERYRREADDGVAPFLWTRWILLATVSDHRYEVSCGSFVEVTVELLHDHGGEAVILP